jgi:AcrR family transcriptional regulator
MVSKPATTGKTKALVGRPAATQEPVSQRGQKRREQIKAATREVLERIGYRAMKVTDVAAKAGIAVGLFYHYFPDLKAATCEVLVDFLDEMAATQVPLPKDRYDVIFAPTLVVVTAFEDHPGLMRCLVQVADEVPEFKAIWNKASTAWTHRVAASIAREFPDGHLNESFSRSLAYALGSMVDGLVNEVFVDRNPDARKLLKTPRDVAELLSAIWYRALYLENPPPADLTLTAPLHGMGTPAEIRKFAKRS